MIEVEEFSVSGFKSLAEVERIPVRKPTIITGANDGGKSTTLRALDFLLGGSAPAPADHTLMGPPAEGNEPLRQESVVVEGRFSLDKKEVEEFALPHTVSLRRVSDGGAASRYEVFQPRPLDPSLRGLDALKQSELRALGERLGLEPQGPLNQREPWLSPLREHVTEQPHEDAWTPAPRALIARLPEIMVFSSTEEPDPEGQIRTALKAAFTELLAREEVVAPIREVESIVQAQLSDKANDLCAHVANRCPELSAIQVVPEVTFTEGFRDVQVLAARPGGAGVALNQSGAGRRRRINLAIWEWTGNLLDARASEDRAVVIAYDEPDTHLDYGHQRELVSLIRQQCDKSGVRIVVATHSLNLIDRVPIQDVVHLRLDDERTQIERLVSTEHEDVQSYLIGVSEAMGLRNSVLLHERCFVGVEGPTEVQAFPILFRLATGQSLQSAGIALISGNGNEGALRVVEFLRAHGRRLAFVVVDTDSSEGKLFTADKLRGAGIEEESVYFLGTRELEDLFSDEQWVATANRDWPRGDGRCWTEEDFTPLRTATKFSKALESAVRGASTEAPQSKPGYLLALVQGLRNGSEVPGELSEVLSTLETFAAAA